MGISLGLIGRTGVYPADDDTFDRTRQSSVSGASALDANASALDAGGGALRPISLRFLDETLERRDQTPSGAESPTGVPISTRAAARLWLVAALLVPARNPPPLRPPVQ